MQHVYAVIMAGGVGSRFWPASRAKTPKQLLDLTGSGSTMIAATVDRLSMSIPIDRILVVTGQITADAVKEALPQLPKKNVLSEPLGRNTAPCIGWAAVRIWLEDKKGVMAVMPSDHLVANREGFSAAFKTAVTAAADGSIVTFGVRPDRPETGFGYIELSDEISADVHNVVRFVEKPDLATAKKYLEAGNFTWNSGMFFFSADRILEEMKQQMPKLYQGLKKIEAAIKANKESEIIKETYPNLPSQSIDYGIMEGAKNIKCVPVDFGWSDLGSWSAAYEQSKRDDRGNAVDGDCVLIDTCNCLIRAPKDKLMAFVGINNLAVVDTDDCLLICPLNEAQRVKDVVDALKAKGRKDLL